MAKEQGGAKWYHYAGDVALGAATLIPIGGQILRGGLIARAGVQAGVAAAKVGAQKVGTQTTIKTAQKGLTTGKPPATNYADDAAQNLQKAKSAKNPAEKNYYNQKVEDALSNAPTAGRAPTSTGAQKALPAGTQKASTSGTGPGAAAAKRAVTSGAKGKATKVTDLPNISTLKTQAAVRAAGDATKNAAKTTGRFAKGTLQGIGQESAKRKVIQKAAAEAGIVSAGAGGRFALDNDYAKFYADRLGQAKEQGTLQTIGAAAAPFLAPIQERVNYAESKGQPAPGWAKPAAAAADLFNPANVLIGSAVATGVTRLGGAAWNALRIPPIRSSGVPRGGPPTGPQVDPTNFGPRPGLPSGTSGYARDGSGFSTQGMRSIPPSNRGPYGFPTEDAAQRTLNALPDKYVGALRDVYSKGPFPQSPVGRPAPTSIGAPPPRAIPQGTPPAAPGGAPSQGSASLKDWVDRNLRGVSDDFGAPRPQGTRPPAPNGAGTLKTAPKTKKDNRPFMEPKPKPAPATQVAPRPATQVAPRPATQVAPRPATQVAPRPGSQMAPRSTPAQVPARVPTRTPAISPTRTPATVPARVQAPATAPALLNPQAPATTLSQAPATAPSQAPATIPGYSTATLSDVASEVPSGSGSDSSYLPPIPILPGAGLGGDSGPAGLHRGWWGGTDVSAAAAARSMGASRGQQSRLVQNPRFVSTLPSAYTGETPGTRSETPESYKGERKTSEQEESTKDTK
jgi:hypothetical protein